MVYEPVRIGGYGSGEILSPAQGVIESDSGKVSEIWAALSRRKLVLFLAAACGLVGGLVPELVQTPVYRARTSLQLEGFNENYLNLRDLSPNSPLVANASAEAYLQNQLKILQSETLARRVAQGLQLAPERSRRAPSRLLSRVLERLGVPAQRRLSPEEARTTKVIKGTTVRSSLQSQILEVLFDSPDPALAAMVANAIASEYVALNREARWQTVSDTTEWLTRETADLKLKLEKSGQELQHYAKSSDLLFSLNTAQDTLGEQKAQQLQQALLTAQNDRTARQSRYEAARSNPDVLPDLVDEPQLRELQQKSAGLKSDLAQLQALYTPSHYKVVRLKAEINEVGDATARRRATLIGRIQSDFETSLRVEQLLASNYARQTRSLQEAMEKTTRYSILKREFEMTQKLYDSMLQKVKEAAVASALRTTNIRVIDIARPPALPFSPNPSLNCAIGLAGGIFFGVGLVIFKEHSDSSFRHAGDSRTLLNLRELGVIPVASLSNRTWKRTRPLTPEIDSSSLDLATWQHGPEMLAESFRGTTASILFSSGCELSPRIFIFTSTNTMEGKTTVLSNVGIALAEAQRRVLLIDGDLRRPRLHKIFSVCNDRGLTDLIQGQADTVDKCSLTGYVHQTHIPGVSILPSGPGVARIGSILHSPSLKLLLARFHNEYDVILIDTPPVGVFSDARVLGRLADSVILVVRAGQTRQDDIRASCWQFIEDQTPIHGVILNGLNDHARAANQYNYYTRSRSTRTA